MTNDFFNAAFKAKLARQAAIGFAMDIKDSMDTPVLVELLTKGLKGYADLSEVELMVEWLTYGRLMATPAEEREVMATFSLHPDSALVLETSHLDSFDLPEEG